MIYIIMLLIFFFVWSLISAILLTIFYKEKIIDKLKYYDKDYVVKEKIENNKTSLLKILSNLIPNIKFSKKHDKKLESELMKSDIPITVEELLVIKMLTSTSFAFLTFALSRNLIIVFLMIVIIWNMPKVIISHRKKERVKSFNEQLNEGTMIISNSLKAGYSFLQAIAAVAEETKDPFAKEFKKLLKEMSLGISEEIALHNMLNRMDSEDLRLILNAILIQKDIGGNLSEILDNISNTIRERQKIQNELKTLTAQGRLSGIIVMLIPFFLGITIYLFNKEYMMLLFTTPLGLGMIITAFLNQILGLIMIRKIIKIDM
ncbi:type II secretion system F family protein [Clostridium algoriphilum]|uniref:type II secretion system F family protein n=1 Tax=Clostridium algoriphilum TaxID=198347 RepID=UPI001CF568E1|nr:type II secretion system F family protein [Clostridium algoriphilum]MCB2294209.1 type II secretion system F family protein [Clostridium algoriphilum]